MAANDDDDRDNGSIIILGDRRREGLNLDALLSRVDEAERAFTGRRLSGREFWRSLREFLAAPWRDWDRGAGSGDVLSPHPAGVIAGRLDRAEELLTSFTLAEWDRLCLIVLPECYGDAGEPSGGPTQEIPGTWAKGEVMAERAALGEQLQHPGDLWIIEDRVGLLRPEGVTGPRLCDPNAPTPPREVTLQGEEREEVGRPGYNAAIRHDSLTRTACRDHS